MPVLLVIVVVAVLAFLAYRFYARRPAQAAPEVAAQSDRAFAYLANGLLFRRERGGTVEQVHSPYIQETMERRERVRERHGWKEGTAFGIRANGGMRGFEQGDAPIVATSAAWQADGSLLYFLKDNAVGGLFRREASSGRELRLLLKQNLHLVDLCLAPEGDRLACSVHKGGGVANVAVLGTDGENLREVTGGDTVDTAPAWIPGVPNRLLFQSAGLARDERGYIVAQGPASIQTLDMGTGSIAPILDDPRFDHLRPRVCPAGHLHFIRRPHDTPAYGVPNLLLDTLLFPFRLLRAVFHWLNFFSLMYTRKPLTSANGPKREADLKDILLQGKRIDAEKALRESRAVQGVPSLVPDSWQLVRRDAQGREQVLATNVASYDIGPDGTIFYSNGRGVFVLEQAGGSRLALSGELVGDVVAAG